MAKRRKGQTLIQASRRVPAWQKAMFHQVLGAGKSRVRREFFGLTDEETRKIGDRLGAAIQRQIDKA